MIRSIKKLLLLCSSYDIRRLKILFALTVLVGLLEIAGIASIIPFLQLASNPESVESNQFINNTFGFFNITEYKSKLIFVGWFVLLFFTLSNITNAFSGWIIQKLGWQLSHTIATRIADTYLHLPYDIFIQREVADIIKSANADVNNLVNNVLIEGCRFFTNILVSITIIILLAIINPIVAVTSFLLVASAFTITFISRKRYISTLGKQQLEHNSRRYITFTDLLHGNRTIQSSNSHQYFFRRFESPSKLFSDIQPKLFLSGALPRYVIETVMFGTIILLIVYLASNYSNFNNFIPMITLYALAGYRLLPSINKAYVSATLVVSHYHAIDNIYEDFEHRRSVTNTSNKEINFNHKITFQNVHYRYPESNQFSLKGVTFNIEKGRNTAIVGTSGSGKTTLGNIIVGLLSPTSGELIVDEQLRDDENKTSWVNKIGYVPQEVFLFNGTVEENICFGQSLNKNNLVRASRIAQAHDFITNSLSDQYASIIGDSGIKLSGGQKQRIGLARAIYRNPDVLVLDEATSALDTKTEKLILDAIYSELTDTTLVIIAHRLSTVRNCDKLLLLDGGELVDEGNFEELLAKSELFKELCSYV